MKKILIVDDSLVYRHALTSALAEEKGLEIIAAAKIMGYTKIVVRTEAKK